LPQKPQ